jgi:hypothetical protein
MKPKAESKLLDVAIDGERGVRTLEKIRALHPGNAEASAEGKPRSD